MGKYSEWVGKEVETFDLVDTASHGIENGDRGIVIGVEYVFLSNEKILLVEFADGKQITFYQKKLKLTEPLAPISTVSTNCPRCGGKLVEKVTSASLFSDETTTVNKCKDCGWC